MKRETITPGKVSFILSALLMLLTFTALPAHADFYVIAAGGRGAGTEIKSLPHTISSPGFYYITKDLSCSGSHGITITADNVTLDLMGFSLGGAGGGSYAGVYMSGRSNVEIRNGTVRNFGNYGVYESSDAGQGHRVINIRARDNLSYGIYLKAKGNLVKGCTASGNNYTGIHAGIGSTVTGNTCYENLTGAGICALAGSTVTGNTCYKNGIWGIYACVGSTVTGNTSYSNDKHGILLEGHNLVDQNTAYSNTTSNMTSCGTCVFGTNVGAPSP